MTTPTQTGDKPMVTPELLPCPFCGGEAKLHQDVSYHTGKPLADEWFVICPPCDLIRDQAWAVPKDEAIAAWNTRAQETLSPEQPLDTIQRLGQEFDAPEASPSPKSDGDEYLICKNGMYYRPNAQGYTSSVVDAGRYTLDEPIRHSHPNGPNGPRDGMTYKIAPPKVEASPSPGMGEELERWGFRWRGHDHGTHERMPDGYWTPWHIATAKIAALSRSQSPSDVGLAEENERLREAARNVVAEAANMTMTMRRRKIFDQLRHALSGKGGES